MKIRIEFVPGDMWIGVFYKSKYPCEPAPGFEDFRADDVHFVRRHIYICIVPMLPIHIFWDI